MPGATVVRGRRSTCDSKYSGSVGEVMICSEEAERTAAAGTPGVLLLGDLPLDQRATGKRLDRPRADLTRVLVTMHRDGLLI